MSISITRSVVRTTHVLGAVVCSIEASVEDSVNIETGDSVYMCTINTITDLNSGQMIAPKALPVHEFRGLVRAVQNKHSL